MDKPYRFIDNCIILNLQGCKTRLESLDHPQTKSIRFSERSIWTDRYVFGKPCINSNKMNNFFYPGV